MIQAILKNKIRQDLISEDTLTSSVLGTLLLLPSEFFLKILANATKTSDEKFKYSNFGRLQSTEFWPHWNSKNTCNVKFVEPDVFLRFDNIDLIIEAKRWDDKTQQKEQWQKEIQAYFNEYACDNKKTILFAIGGVAHSNQTETIQGGDNPKISVYKMLWGVLLYEIEKILNEMEKIKSHSENINSSIRILHIIVQSFELHGFLPRKWFENINSHLIENSNKLQYWQTNKNCFFNIKNNYTIEYQSIKLWDI